MVEKFKKMVEKKSEIETGSIKEKLDLYLENSNTEQLKETKELVNKIAELKADRENVNRDLYFADTYDKSDYYEAREKFEKEIEELGKINPKALKIANEIIEFSSSPALDAKDEIKIDLKIFNKEIDLKIDEQKKYIKIDKTEKNIESITDIENRDFSIPKKTITKNKGNER